MAFIQNELNEVKEVWNNHHISHSHQAVVPNGKPDLLYNAPELSGNSYICNIIHNRNCNVEYSHIPAFVVSDYELQIIYMQNQLNNYC